MTRGAAVAVIAKAPVPGRSKTRLCPPCTPEQAARLAEASLADTLATVAAVDGVRRVLVLEGEPGPWLPEGAYEVVPQVGGGLDARLAAAFEAVGERCFLVGMDTPQLRVEHVLAGLAALDRAEASFGPAADGGYWGIGLRCPDPEVFHGVPMSEDHTGAAQLSRLRERGLTVEPLVELRDVDFFEDARLAAALAPGGRFAAAVAEVEAAIVEAAA